MKNNATYRVRVRCRPVSGFPLVGETLEPRGRFRFCESGSVVRVDIDLYIAEESSSSIELGSEIGCEHIPNIVDCPRIPGQFIDATPSITGFTTRVSNILDGVEGQGVEAPDPKVFDVHDIIDGGLVDRDRLKGCWMGK